MSNKVRKQGGETQKYRARRGRNPCRTRQVCCSATTHRMCDPSIGGIARHLILWLCAFGDQAASKTQLHDTTEGDDLVERLISMQLPCSRLPGYKPTQRRQCATATVPGLMLSEAESRTRQVDVAGAPCLARPAPPRPARPLPRLPSAVHDGDAQGATRRQRRFPTGAWMTYKATITQLLRQSITHLIRTLQYMYIAADETLDDLQLPI